MSKILLPTGRWRDLLEIAIEVLKAIRNHLGGRKQGR